MLRPWGKQGSRHEFESMEFTLPGKTNGIHTPMVSTHRRAFYAHIMLVQVGKKLFNKGRLMNAGFSLAQKMGVDCVIFHDVDMLPENDRIPYFCPDPVLHLGAFTSSLNYTYSLFFFYAESELLVYEVSPFVLQVALRKSSGWSSLIPN